VPELAASIADAIALRPDLLALDQALVAKRAQLDAAHGAQLPQLFVAGNFTYAGATNRDAQSNPWASDPLNSLGAGVALGLSQNLAIPLMLAQSEKLEAELQPLLRQRDGLARLVRFEVEQAHAELVMAAEKAAAAKSALGSGKAWFRSAGLDFGLNVTDARTLLDAYSGYVKTQIDAAQASYEYLVARGRLDQVIGKALPEGAASCGLD
jgi:outer membrane protein TolC